MEFPACPPSLKQIQHYLKLSQEHDSRDVVIAYWSRLHALQIGLKLTTQQAEETKLLLALMDWLEAVKKSNIDNEAIANEVAAQAHLENYALKLFLYADKQDREGNFGKNVVKAFYSCGVIYDVLQTFGELSEEALHNRKYAKWKAAYIHNCLKNGEVPVAGPMQDDASNDFNENVGSSGGGFQSNFAGDQTESDKPTVEDILTNPDKLPSPPIEEEKPGGFEPFVPPSEPHPVYTVPEPAADLEITPDQMIMAQKYCKYATSALNYDDVKTAIQNLQKALKLLTTGVDN